MTDLLRAAKVGVTQEPVNPELTRARADGPTSGALLRCYGELRRILQQHRDPRDQAERGIRADPERRAPLKVREPKPQPEEAKVT